MKVCKIKNCRNKILARGRCSTHYGRLPEQVARRKAAKFKARRVALQKRPEAREKRKAYRATAAQKQKSAAYRKSPVNAARYKAYHATPEQRAFRAAYSKTVKGQFVHAKAAAKRTGHEWLLSFEDFTVFRSRLCSYCQYDLPPTGSGLDRLDNSKGYVLGNVAPCCADCNLTRGDRYSHDEMLTEIGPVLRKVKLARSQQLAYTAPASSLA